MRRISSYAPDGDRAPVFSPIPWPAIATRRAGFLPDAYGYFSARARVLRRRGDVAVRPADDSSSVRHGGRSSSC